LSFDLNKYRWHEITDIDRRLGRKKAKLTISRHGIAPIVFEPSDGKAELKKESKRS
jgi:hypothetical protein